MTTGKFDYMSLRTSTRSSSPTFEGKIFLPVTENSYNPNSLLAGTLQISEGASDETNIFVRVCQNNPDGHPSEPYENFVIKSTIQPDKSLGPWTNVANIPIYNYDPTLVPGTTSTKCYGGFLYTALFHDFSTTVTKIYSAPIEVGGSLGAWQVACEDAALTGWEWSYGFFNNRMYLTYLNGTTYSAPVTAGIVGTLVSDASLSSSEGTFYSFFEPYGGNMIKWGGYATGYISNCRAYVASVNGITGRITSWTPNDGSTFGDGDLEGIATSYYNGKIVNGYLIHSVFTDGPTWVNSRKMSVAGNFTGTLWDDSYLTDPAKYSTGAVLTSTHWYCPMYRSYYHDDGTFRTYYSPFY